MIVGMKAVKILGSKAVSNPGCPGGKKNGQIIYAGKKK